MRKYVNFSDENKGDWDEFCEQSDEAWFWHTSKWIEYTLLYNPDARAKNLSFFLMQDNKPVAICPLIMEEDKGVREFLYGRNYIPVPAFQNDVSIEEKKILLSEIFHKIDEIAIENNVKRAGFRFSALDRKSLSLGAQKANYLPDYGFSDVSIKTQIIDLSLSKEALRSNLRHGHKSDITKAERELEVEIFDRENITKEIFEAYKALKTKHGGSTRPEETFDLMFQWVKEGSAFLSVARQSESWVSFAYFFSYKDNVYYGSAINAPDAPDLPLAHAIQWQSILYMKEKGMQFYEIGWQVYEGDRSEFVSPKKINISKFTRGFGGETYPLYMGEKLYDK